MKRTKIGLALEAVRNQVNPRLFLGLNEIIGPLLEKGAKEGVENSDLDVIAEFLKKETQMDFQMVPSSPDSYDAFTVVPDVDANNPIAQDMWRWARASEDGLRKIMKAQGAIRGFVDMETGRVGGVFSQVPVKLCMGRGWFNSKKPFCCAEELSAIILHETGHNFTYFETMLEVCTANVVMQALAQDWLVADRTKRLKMLDAINDSTKFTVDSKSRDQLVNIDEAESVVNVLITGDFFDSRSMFGTAAADRAGWEAASDQFAIRMGAGDWLGSGLAKMYKHSSPFYTKTRAAGFFSDVITIMQLGKAAAFAGAAVLYANPLFLVVTATSLGMMALNIINASNDTFGEYDAPRKRIERIIVQTRGYLKEKGVPRERVIEILGNLEQLQKYIDELSKGNRLFESLVNMVFRSRDREIDLRRRHELIESLANNELYAVAAALRQ